jgi:mannose-6-phosphate isomerase-like protein (cupin superfamily)
MVFTTNIEKDTIENNNYRKVINTSNNIQLVLMSLKPKEEIGREIHDNIDQFFRIEKGNGLALVEENGIINKIELNDGSVIIIPKGTFHNIINIGDNELKLYTIYSPPNHPKDRVQLNKPLEDKDGGYYYKKYLKYKAKYSKLKYI